VCERKQLISSMAYIWDVPILYFGSPILIVVVVLTPSQLMTGYYYAVCIFTVIFDSEN
jgi:hypothetical protein